MLFEIYFPCLTSSRCLCPLLGAAVGSVAFHNAWDHIATPWMAHATIKLFKLKWSAVGRLLSQGRLAICTLWNWSLTKYMVKEEQQSSGLECTEASEGVQPAYEGLRSKCRVLLLAAQAGTVTCKWSQSRHFVGIVLVFWGVFLVLFLLLLFAWRVFWFVGFFFACLWVLWGFFCWFGRFVLFVCFLFWLNRFTRIYLWLCIFASLKKIDLR